MALRAFEIAEGLAPQIAGWNAEKEAIVTESSKLDARMTSNREIIAQARATIEQAQEHLAQDESSRAVNDARLRELDYEIAVVKAEIAFKRTGIRPAPPTPPGRARFVKVSNATSAIIATQIAVYARGDPVTNLAFDRKVIGSKEPQAGVFANVVDGTMGDRVYMQGLYLLGTQQWFQVDLADNVDVARIVFVSPSDDQGHRDHPKSCGYTLQLLAADRSVISSHDFKTAIRGGNGNGTFTFNLY